MAAVQLLRLGPGALEVPVQVVELELAELHVFPIGVQEALDHRQGAVGGEAQVPDAPGLLLAEQVLQHAVVRVQIGAHVALVYVVKEVEVEVVHAALLQLLLEDGLHPVRPDVGHVVAGEFGGQEPALPRITGQHAAHHPLGIAVVIAIGRVKVVGPPLHGQGHHLGHRRLVHVAVPTAGQQRQPHAAEAQHGQAQVLKVLVDHGMSLPYIDFNLPYSLEYTPSQAFFPKTPKSPGQRPGLFGCVLCVLQRCWRGIREELVWEDGLIRFISESVCIIPCK